MKRECFGSLKLQELADALDVSEAHAAGTLSYLWNVTAQNSPRGDIGRFTNRRIAKAVCWDGDPDRLVRALVETRWLDEHETHRLVIHDWHQHCEDSVHARVARRRELFADGSVPKLTKLAKGEREEVEAFYAVSDTAAAILPTGADGSLPPPLPEPLPSPLPPPLPTPPDFGGGGVSLSEVVGEPDRVRDVCAGLELQGVEVAPVQLLAVGFYCQAQAKNPGGLFQWCLEQRAWDRARPQDVDRARRVLGVKRSQRPVEPVCVEASPWEGELAERAEVAA